MRKCFSLTEKKIHGIKIKFDEYNKKDADFLYYLERCQNELKRDGTVNEQKEPKIFDYEILELHQMIYVYLIQLSKKPLYITKYKEMNRFVILTVKKMSEKLYDITIQNQELHKLLLKLEDGQKIQISEALNFGFVSDMTMKIKSYEHEKLKPEFQKQFNYWNNMIRKLRELGPRKILQDFKKNPKDYSNDMPVFDPQYYELCEIFVLFHSRWPDRDTFSVMASIIEKMGELLCDNATLKLRLENMEAHNGSQ